MRNGIALGALLALLAGAAAGARADEFDLAAAQALFEAKCVSCHSLDRALRKSKDRERWEKSVARMKRYASGLISDQDAGTIVEYLVRTRGPAQ